MHSSYQLTMSGKMLVKSSKGRVSNKRRSKIPDVGNYGTVSMCRHAMTLTPHVALEIWPRGHGKHRTLSSIIA